MGVIDETAVRPTEAAWLAESVVTSRQSASRTALAGLIGNVIEWFDFAVYGYFATDIGRQFFPQSSATSVSDRLHLLANQVETMLPEMERLGITTAAEVALGTLVERMDDEIHAESSVIVGRSEIGAWCQI